MADLGPAHAAKKFLCPIGACAVQAVGLFVVDALHFEAGVKIVPGRRLVGVHDPSLGEARADEIERLPFRAEHGRERIAVALADDDHGLALARLVGGEATILALLGKVGWLT
jgi:hypothetical protein